MARKMTRSEEMALTLSYVTAVNEYDDNEEFCISVESDPLQARVVMQHLAGFVIAMSRMRNEDEPMALVQELCTLTAQGILDA